jgi:hypothetical protein
MLKVAICFWASTRTLYVNDGESGASNATPGARVCCVLCKAHNSFYLHQTAANEASKHQAMISRKKKGADETDPKIARSR